MQYCDDDRRIIAILAELSKQNAATLRASLQILTPSSNISIRSHADPTNCNRVSTTFMCKCTQAPLTIDGPPTIFAPIESEGYIIVP